MSQLSATQYKRLTQGGPTYGQSDGLYWDATNSQLCLVMGDAIVARINASGITADLELTGEARGDLLRRGASAWERVVAKTSGQVMLGDGTDVISAALSGDVASVSAAGAVTVDNLTLGSDAAGDMFYKSGAATTARLAKGAAADVMVMNAGATAPSWVAMSGDATIAATGALTLADKTIKYAEVTILSASIVGTDAGDIGHASGTEIVAAPGAGKVLEFVSGVVIYDYATAAYTDGGDVGFIYPSFSACSGVVSAANSVGAAGDKVALLLPAVPTNNQMPSNTSIALTSAVGFTQPGTAAGVVRVKCAYRVHSTGL